MQALTGAMYRRDFIKQSAALLAVSGLPSYAGQLGDMKKRVGLIGTGWYGKSDLLRLVQVAPVEVVSLCDVDKQMLSDAAELVATRQLSKKRPRTYSDYREMLKERDLDIVLVGTPDHWHALPMIEAVKSGVDVWVQKPISVDVVEGQAMLAAARKYKRVVQVGMQRRSTPHLVHARDRVIKEGKLGTIGLVEIYCYYHMRATAESPGRRSAREPRLRDVDRAGADAAVQLARAPAQLARVHGVRQRDRRRHVRAHARHGALDAGPRHADAHQLDGRHLRRQEEQGEHHRHADRDVRIPQPQRRLDAPLLRQLAGPEVSVGARPSTATRARSRPASMRYDFIPQAKGEAPIHEDVVFELEQFPEDKTEKDLERHVAPAIRGHMKDFLECIASRGTPVADIEQGYMSATACILANLSMDLGRSLQWDHAKGVVVGDAEANKRLRRPYRSPWVHPEPGTV